MVLLRSEGIGLQTRRHVITFLSTGLIATLPISRSRADGLDEVKLGIPRTISDAAFYACVHNEYFVQQKLNVSFVNFQAGSQMVAPLGAGQVDAATGATSAGLYNAIARGIDVKIVADKSSNMPDYCYMPLMVRKDHVESGRYKDLSDLKGFKIAEAGKGGCPGSTLNEALKHGGLKYDDVVHVYNMPYPDMVAALANKAVDAAIVTEPTVAVALTKDVAVRYPSDQFYPRQNVSPLLYSGNFVKNRPDVARRFMIAYLQGVRFYRGACKDGRLSGPNAEKIIDMMIQETSIKNLDVYKRVTPNGCDPDGRLVMESLEKDLAFFRDRQLINGSISVDQAVDTSFVEAALKTLGPYQSDPK